VSKEYSGVAATSVGITAFLTSGIGEPAAISGNIRRARERCSSNDLLILTPAASDVEIEQLKAYLYEDRIYDAHLLVGAAPKNQHLVRRFLRQNASENLTEDTYALPSFLDQVRDRYREYRAGDLPSPLW
jgi:hypothetical protein